MALLPFKLAYWPIARWDRRQFRKRLPKDRPATLDDILNLMAEDHAKTPPDPWRVAMYRGDFDALAEAAKAKGWWIHQRTPVRMVVARRRGAKVRLGLLGAAYELARANDTVYMCVERGEDGRLVAGEWRDSEW